MKLIKTSSILVKTSECELKKVFHMFKVNQYKLSNDFFFFLPTLTISATMRTFKIFSLISSAEQQMIFKSVYGVKLAIKTFCRTCWNSNSLYG